MTKTLDLQFQLGEPVEHRGVVIAPLYPRRDPVARYLTLEEALVHGLTVREVSEAGVVPELAVENPLKDDVLMYDGEELLGAKQNRVLNVTVLVAAESKLTIPVSCVEQGRWSSRSAQFAAAPHASNPRLRRRKAEALRAAPLARGLAQADVWDEVALAAERLDVHSATGANAVDRLDRPAGAEAIPEFVSAIADATVTRGPSAGRGEDLRLAGASLIGSGLELDGETLQVSAFTATGAPEARLGRIARPSRRRTA